MLFFLLPTYSHAQMEVIKDLYERALDAYSKQQYTQAISFYQKIIQVVPTFAAAYNGMALANQAAMGDEEKTIEYLKAAIRYDPKMVSAYDNLGRIYYARQDVNHAQEYFEKALKVDGNLASAQLSLAWINLLVRSRPMAALKYFNMIPAQSRDRKTIYGMGSAYFASNQREKAMEVITKLHDMGEEELASRLEKSLRENAQVNTQADLNAPDSSVMPAGLGELEPTVDKPTGVQVHLRGRLSDY